LNPESLDKEDVSSSLSVEQNPLPIAKVVLKKMSKEEIASVTGEETRVRSDDGQLDDHPAQSNNGGGSLSVLLDDSVIELNQEDHQSGSSPPPLTAIDLSNEIERPLQGPSPIQIGSEDVIIIDDEEEREPSNDNDIVFLDLSLDFQNDSSVDTQPLPSPSANGTDIDTTIDLTKSDSPFTDKLKPIRSSSSSNSVPETLQEAPTRDPLTCPICFESYVDLSKESVKLLMLGCGHVCCGPCVEACLERRLQCPICRAEVRRGEPRQLFI